jgi:DNA-binding transcriptional ArsR family regulator
VTAGGRDRGGGDDNGQWREELIGALNHPTRRRILRLLLDRGQRLSPVEMARKLKTALGETSYHVRILCDRHAVKAAGTRQVRGAMQRFYEAAIEEDPPIEALLEETRETDEAHAAKARRKPRKPGKPRKRRKRK